MTELLTLENLNKSFGALKATDDVSLTLRAGEIHALIGPNGAGKSTLIGQIAGTLTPDAGRVVLDGQDVTALPTADRAARGLGRTFQISQLAPDHTALENAVLSAVGAMGRVGFWRRAVSDKPARDRAEQALERVGLSNRANVLTGELSHGERRQLEIACALTMQPKVFLMDEPMAGLGSAGTAEITTLLDGLRVEAPILLIEHDMDAVFALADRVSVLVSGKIIATGTVAEVRQNVDVRQAYLGDEA